MLHIFSNPILLMEPTLRNNNDKKKITSHLSAHKLLRLLLSEYKMTFFVPLTVLLLLA